MKIWSTCLLRPEITRRRRPGLERDHERALRELLAKGRSEVGDERDVLLAERFGDRLEVEAGAVGLACGHELDRLRDELLLRLLIAEEGLHFGEVVPAEQLERRHDPDAVRMGRVGDRDRVLADEGRIPEAALVEVASGLDADAEEGDRREQPVVEAVCRLVIELPIGEVAVDLVRQAGRAVDSGTDRARADEVLVVGCGPLHERIEGEEPDRHDQHDKEYDELPPAATQHPGQR